MKYQPGDEIIVLLSNEEGRVVEIINDQLVMIDVRGVKFPAYMDQIDFPYFKRFTEKKLVKEKTPPKVYIDQLPKEKPVANRIQVEDGFWLSAIPRFTLDDFNDEIVAELKIYLVNKTADTFAFQYKQQAQGEDQFIFSSEIGPFQDFYLHNIAFEKVNDGLSFWVDCTLQPPNKKRATHFESNLKWKAKAIFKKMEELKEQNAPSASYLLFSEYPVREADPPPMDISSLSRKGYKVYDATRIREHLPPARSVIDLHAEKLTAHWQSMQPDEILQLQLDELTKWLDLAVAHNLPAMVIIHGVGKGVLRNEIHSLLKTRKEVKSFVQQYEPAYGDGATRVFFNT